MDTKKLYIKTQKNFLNWIVGILSLTLASVVYSLFAKNPSATPIYSIWISLLVYLCLFSASLYNRIKQNSTIARSAFYLYAIFSVYSIVEMILKYKSTQQMIKLMQPNTNTTFFMITGYVVGTLFILGFNYLFYRGYKATDRIIKLNEANI